MNQLEQSLLMTKYDAMCKDFLSNKSIAGALLKLVTKSSETIEDCGKRIRGNSVKCQQLQNNFKRIPGDLQNEIICDLVFGSLNNDFILHLEPQGDYNVFYKQKNRPRKYANTLAVEANNILGIDEAKNYQKVIPIYSVWILLFPPKEKQGIIKVEKVQARSRQYNNEFLDETNIQDSITTLYLDQNIRFTGDYAFEILCIIMSTTIEPKAKVYLLDKLYNIQLVNKEKEMLTNMCNFSIGFLQEGERIGIEKGERIGIEKGEKIGIEKGEKIGIGKGEKIGIGKGECKSIIKFMKKTACSINDALDFFDIPKEDSARYINMIDQLSNQNG